MSDQFCDTVCTEWLLYATDTAQDSAVDEFPNNICAYWLHVSNIFDSGRKDGEVSMVRLRPVWMTNHPPSVL